MNINMNAEDRREAWNEALHSDEAMDWDYGQWLVQVIEQKFEAIEEMFGAEFSHNPLLALLMPAAEAEGFIPISWRDALGDNENARSIHSVANTEWPISNMFLELGLYGRYGVTKEDINIEGREEYLFSLLGKAENFVKTHDIVSASESDNPLKKITALARSRWNIDHNEGDVDPQSLSILGGLSEGRIRNLMSGENRLFENVGGRIAAKSALAWLQQRSEFYNSIWNLPDFEPTPSTTPNSLIEDVVFVPYAKDGTFFNPSYSRGGNYTIGEKGSEIRFENFTDALTTLQKMGNEARWRRPNSNGNWGIVSVQDWRPIERDVLNSLDK